MNYFLCDLVGYNLATHFDFTEENEEYQLHQAVSWVADQWLALPHKIKNRKLVAIWENRNLIRYEVDDEIIAYISRNEENPVAYMRVEAGRTISIQYTIWTDLSDDEPLQRDCNIVYVQGAREVLSALQNQLENHLVGDNVKFTVSPEQAYGLSKPDNNKVINWTMDEPPEIGDIIGIADDGDEYLAWIEDIISETEVLVNFNPPLADRTLTYDVDILEVN